MKKSKSLIGILISIILIVLLLHPARLPLPETTVSAMQELIRGHFLLKGSGTDTVSALMDACKSFDNATVTVENGKITLHDIPGLGITPIPGK